MIPKVIHYCWFGRNPLPDAVKRCIRSWKKYCPEYQIIQWNEDNFDVHANRYMYEAYEAKKWAFVTDVARLMIIYEHGGIYLDTDVELIKPLDQLLSWEGYFGMEGTKVNTGIGFGAVPKCPVIKTLLDSYEDISFVKNDGSIDNEPCTDKNTRVLCEMGYRENGQEQVINGVHILPAEYLCPIDFFTHEKHITPNTISIHHYSMSWMTEKERGFWKYQWRVYAIKKTALGRKLIQIKKRLFK